MSLCTLALGGGSLTCFAFFRGGIPFSVCTCSWWGGGVLYRGRSLAAGGGEGIRKSFGTIMVLWASLNPLGWGGLLYVSYMREPYRVYNLVSWRGGGNEAAAWQGECCHFAFLYGKGGTCLLRISARGREWRWGHHFPSLHPPLLFIFTSLRRRNRVGRGTCSLHRAGLPTL